MSRHREYGQKKNITKIAIHCAILLHVMATGAVVYGESQRDKWVDTDKVLKNFADFPFLEQKEKFTILHRFFKKLQSPDKKGRIDLIKEINESVLRFPSSDQSEVIFFLITWLHKFPKDVQKEIVQLFILVLENSKSYNFNFTYFEDIFASPLLGYQIKNLDSDFLDEILIIGMRYYSFFSKKNKQQIIHYLSSFKNNYFQDVLSMNKFFENKNEKKIIHDLLDGIYVSKDFFHGRYVHENSSEILNGFIGDFSDSKLIKIFFISFKKISDASYLKIKNEIQIIFFMLSDDGKNYILDTFVNRLMDPTISRKERKNILIFSYKNFLLFDEKHKKNFIHAVMKLKKEEAADADSNDLDDAYSNEPFLFLSDSFDLLNDNQKKILLGRAQTYLQSNNIADRVAGMSFLLYTWNTIKPFMVEEEVVSELISLLSDSESTIVRNVLLFTIAHHTEFSKANKKKLIQNLFGLLNDLDLDIRLSTINFFETLFLDLNPKDKEYLISLIKEKTQDVIPIVKKSAIAFLNKYEQNSREQCTVK